jgi:subtilisin family serine protease
LYETDSRNSWLGLQIFGAEKKTMTHPSLAMPWASSGQAYCLPGSVVVKMVLGEAPEKIPAAADIRNGRLSAAQCLDGGVVDRIVRHYAGEMHITRVHAAAAGIRQPGEMHRGFDDREQVFGLARTFRFDVSPGTPIGPLVDSLNQVVTVESASPNYLCLTPFGAALPSPDESDWAPWQMIRAPEALAYETGDPSVTVAVVDSGVAFNHPELQGRLRPGFDTVQLGQSELATGLELLGDRTRVDTNPTDRYVGHGMGCSGIIGALGVSMAPGLAGDTRILPLRALGAARFPGKNQAVGIGAITDLDMATKLAVDLGAKVINMSFGTDDAALDPAMPKPHADVVRYALDRGCILVAASGNNGAETLYWPAAYPGVIAVGAVGAGARPSHFSTRGDHVALCGPGERIFTLALEGYQYATGTSFAAPFVTATAALMVARAQQRSTPLNSEKVRSLLMASAGPFGGPPPTGCGAGVLDCYAALRALDAFIDRSLPDDTGDTEDS